MIGLLKHIVNPPSIVRNTLVIIKGYIYYHWSLKTKCGFFLKSLNRLSGN